MTQHLRNEARRLDKLKHQEEASQVTLSRPEHKGMLAALLVGTEQSPISAMVDGLLGIELATEAQTIATGEFPATKEVSDVEPIEPKS